METEQWLTHDRDDILKKALQHHGKTEKELQESIRIILDWLKDQKHLPEILCVNRIVNFLLMNKFSIEITKERIDMYYTIRHLLPEVYDSKVNSADDMREVADICYLFPLPKRTAEGDRISVIQPTNISEDNFDIYRLMGFCFNLLDLRLQEDLITHDIIVDDLRNIRMSHIVRVTPIHLKKIVMILEKVFKSSIKQIHFLNCPKYAQTILDLLKQLMKPKLAARIIIHDEQSQISKYISKDILPSDFGGSERSLHELNELWKQKLSGNHDRFAALSNLRTNEKLRPTPLKNDELLGYHGNFRKLEMD